MDDPSINDPNASWEGKRWYDQDPALCRALNTLREASDKYQAQIALNIIKVILEHHIESQAQVEIESLNHETLAEKGFNALGLPHSQEHQERRRWYDVNETLRSAMQLLRDTPDDLQQKIIPTIARMIEQTLEGSHKPL